MSHSNFGGPIRFFQVFWNRMIGMIPINTLKCLKVRIYGNCPECNEYAFLRTTTHMNISPTTPNPTCVDQHGYPIPFPIPLLALWLMIRTEYEPEPDNEKLSSLSEPQVRGPLKGKSSWSKWWPLYIWVGNSIRSPYIWVDNLTHDTEWKPKQTFWPGLDVVSGTSVASRMSLGVSLDVPGFKNLFLL